VGVGCGYLSVFALSQTDGQRMIQVEICRKWFQKSLYAVRPEMRRSRVVLVELVSGSMDASW
jgi:hypothetical protein